ncbi:MAG: DUF2508 family protein [Bacteroidales bacterium]|nr:DUF2508 family protein [Clostridium sp.]MCM1204310.1 DUF2508 family protein [Bacteroidales bacterium]
MRTKPRLKILSSRESRTKKKRNPSPHQRVMTDSSLLDDLSHAKKDIDTILFHLNYQTDPDLIDSYCYQLKGAYMRYRFFLRQVQQMHI